MKVALYQEGEFHCAPDVIKIFRAFAVAKSHIPKGYVIKETMSDLYAEKAIEEERVTENDVPDRWVTIDEYKVIK